MCTVRFYPLLSSRLYLVTLAIRAILSTYIDQNLTHGLVLETIDLPRRGGQGIPIPLPFTCAMQDKHRQTGPTRQHQPASSRAGRGYLLARHVRENNLGLTMQCRCSVLTGGTTVCAVNEKRQTDHINHPLLHAPPRGTYDNVIYEVRNRAVVDLHQSTQAFGNKRTTPRRAPNPIKRLPDT